MKFSLEGNEVFGKEAGNNSALILAECLLGEPPAKKSFALSSWEKLLQDAKSLKSQKLLEPLEPWRESILQLLPQISQLPQDAQEGKQAGTQAKKQNDCTALAVSEKQGGLPLHFSSLRLEKLESAALLQWGKSLGAKIAQQKWQQVLFSLGSQLELKQLGLEQLRLVLEGLWFGHYRFHELKTQDKKADKSKPKELCIYLHSSLCKTAADKKSLRALLKDLEQQIAASKQTLKLVLSPANICTPEFFSDFAAEQAGKLKNVKTEIWGEEQLQKKNMNLILAVGQGSPRESRLLILDYCGDKNNSQHVALVGKGVCFDTGGTNLKPSAFIKGMQYDMMGAGIVYGAFYYLASTGFAGNIKAYIPLVENQIGSHAIMTGDIIESAMGPTVEINNTDAEGRLILADAIHCAVQKKPRLLIDCATLTGAAIVALGDQCAAYYSSDEAAGALFAQASRETGEDVWQMPLFRPYASYLDSKLADFSNISTKSPGGGSLTAALFLEKFVRQQHTKQDKKQSEKKNENTTELPWIHLDLASWSSLDEHPSYGKNTHSMGLRLLARFLRGYLAK